MPPPIPTKMYNQLAGIHCVEISDTLDVADNVVVVVVVVTAKEKLIGDL